MVLMPEGAMSGQLKELTNSHVQYYDLNIVSLN
jgi:hypothetical protein